MIMKDFKPRTHESHCMAVMRNKEDTDTVSRVFRNSDEKQGHAALKARLTAGAILALSAPAIVGTAMYIHDTEPARAGMIYNNINHSYQQFLLTMVDKFAESKTDANWSGYVTVSTPGTFKGISSTFVVPKITWVNSKSGVAVWTGIDGYLSDKKNLLQAGVFVNKNEVEVWTQAFPNKPSYMNGIKINQGDIVTVNITEDGGGLWTAQFKDDTTGKGLSANIEDSVPAYSAECIVERAMISKKPHNDAYVLTRASFNSVEFKTCMPRLTSVGVEEAANFNDDNKTDLIRAFRLDMANPKGYVTGVSVANSLGGFTVEHAQDGVIADNILIN